MNFEDSASELTDREQEAIIKAARAKASVKKFPFIGMCYSCETPIEDVNRQKVFCNIDCRDDYENMCIRSRNGRC